MEEGKYVVLRTWINDMNAFTKDDKAYICLNILPDPISSEGYYFEVFVKDYELKDKEEPPSYDQEIPPPPLGTKNWTKPTALENRYLYIKRVMVPESVVNWIAGSQERIEKLRKKEQQLATAEEKSINRSRKRKKE